MDSTKRTATNEEEEVLPSKDSELTEEFLSTYVNIHPNSAKLVTPILKKKGVFVVSDLLVWESKDELLKDLFGKLEDPDYFKVSAGHLWNFILKYHPERAIQAIPPSEFLVSKLNC